MADSAYEGWAVLEQLGHRRTAGRVSTVDLFGAPMGRIDIPRADGTYTTHFFSAASVYAVTPTTEEIARGVALRNQPEPVSRYELEPPRPAPVSSPGGSARYAGPQDDDGDPGDDRAHEDE